MLAGQTKLKSKDNYLWQVKYYPKGHHPLKVS
jgi:hypothetical protein